MNRPRSRHPVLAAAARFAVAALLPAALLPGWLVAQEKQRARLEKLIPDDVIAYARFADLTGKIETFLESGLGRKIASSPLFEELLDDRDLRRGLDRLRRMEETTGLDVTELLGEVFRREVTLGLFLDFSGPQGVLLARFSDGEEARRMVKRLRDAAALATGKPPRGTRSEYEGETIETFESVAFAVIDDVLAVSSHAGVLESVVDLAAGRTTRSVFLSKTYGSVMEADRPPLQLALRPNFLPAVGLPEKLDPLPSLLFGGWLGAIHASKLLVVDLQLDGSGLVLRGSSLVGSPGLGEKLEPWFPRDGASSLATRLSLDRELATVEVHRDLAAWWSSREDLVVAGARQKLDVLARYVSVVFGGVSFERDVLSEIGSPITLVTRRQRYSGATPEPAIPAFALIVPLRNPATFGPALLAAGQRLVGVARVEQMRRGEERGAELIQRTKDVGGRTLHSVELTSRGGASRPGLIDNFSPCLVILDAHAVLSSTTALAETLIGRLAGVAARPESPAGAIGVPPTIAPAADSLALDSGELRQALELNRGRLGQTDDSDVGLRALELFLELFTGARLSSVRRGNLLRLSLELSAGGR